METIHERLKRLRNARGLSFQAVADFVTKAAALKRALSWQAVQQWEGELKGVEPTAPRRKKIEALAELYGVASEEIMFGSKDERKKNFPKSYKSIEISSFLTDDERDLLEGFRHADTPSKNAMLLMARSITSAAKASAKGNGVR
ncbi:hypothetical protein GALL_153100 [mine drainage metagenome]|uniref:Uncharacterized protein n=1 Tax=mine drainage metagenome TaxID=410659 RepID=A0A1J5SLM3_9ZZZZ